MASSLASLSNEADLVRCEHVRCCVSELLKAAREAAGKGVTQIVHTYCTHDFLLRDDTRFHDVVATVLYQLDESIVRVSATPRRRTDPTQVVFAVQWTRTPIPRRTSNVSFQCPVCLETTPANVLIPCGHHVCVECRRQLNSPTCPTCKRRSIGSQAVFANLQ